MSEKPQNLPDVAKQQDIQKTKENIAKTTADSYTKEGIIKTITNEPKSVKDITSKYLKQSLDLKDYSDKKDAELNAILEWKESKEKHSEKVRDSIMMQTMNPESVDGYVDRLKAKIAENWGQLTLTKDIQKARLELNREIYSERKDKLDSPLLDKDWKPLYIEGKKITKTKYEDILEKNKDLAKLNTDQNPDLAKELLAVYWEKWISSYMKLLKDVPEDKIPKNLEEINKLMEQKFWEKYLKERMSEKREWDKPLPPEELKKEIKKSFSNPNTVNALATSYNQVPWENVKWSLEWTGWVEELNNEVIKKLPEWKVKSLFSNLLHFIWKWKTDPELRKFVKSNSNWDPIDWYYCRAFLNAWLESIGIPTNKNNLSKDALNIWREVPKKEEMLPWDIVVLSRNWTDTSGNPWTHVWIFAWWTKNGDMLFLSWNSTWWRVTCKPRSTKKIIWMRRFVDSKEENALRNIEK